MQRFDMPRFKIGVFKIVITKSIINSCQHIFCHGKQVWQIMRLILKKLPLLELGKGDRRECGINYSTSQRNSLKLSPICQILGSKFLSRALSSSFKVPWELKSSQLGPFCAAWQQLAVLVALGREATPGVSGKKGSSCVIVQA